jgi:hypothetical protein
MHRLHQKLEALEKYLDMKSVAAEGVLAAAPGAWDVDFAHGMKNVIFGAKEIIND